MLRALALLATGTMILTSCLVGDPALGDLAGTADAEPSLVDVAYGTELGCEQEPSDELCGGSQLIDIYPAAAGASILQ